MRRLFNLNPIWSAILAALLAAVWAVALIVLSLPGAVIVGVLSTTVSACAVEWIRSPGFTPLRAAVASGFLAVFWIALMGLGLVPPGAVSWVAWAVAFMLGFAWTIYFVERFAARFELRPPVRDEVWNPLNPFAWFYQSAVMPALLVLGCLAVLAADVAIIVLERRAPSTFPPAVWEWIRAVREPVEVAAALLIWVGLAGVIAQSAKLRQTLAVSAGYALFFTLVYILAHLRFGNDVVNIYDLPAGGGKDSVKATAVKVQKVVRKRYVINPYSTINFNTPPPIDKIDLKFSAETAERYKAGKGGGGLGDGDGDGGGFGGGVFNGKIRFLRIRHADKTWDKNFGIGGDNNLLAELVSREPKMAGKVADATEAIDIGTLGTFPPKKSPPVVYVGGAHGFSPTATEKKALQRYITEQHGMILGDNLGGPGFHNSFVAVMNEITGTQAVEISRDDRIHQRPYELPEFPYVVAHGGTVPKGWKVDGRWVAYYHPGAMSDAWRDDRAGIKKDIAELCFQLGINIVFYAHVEYGRWVQSQQP